MKMPRLKFSLRTLLLASTVIAILFGVSQAHRRNVVRTVEELNAAGLNTQVSDEWRDWLWLRVPREAGISISQLPNGITRVGQSEHDVEEAVSRVVELRNRAMEFGIPRTMLFFTDVKSTTVAFDAQAGYTPTSDEVEVWMRNRLERN